MDHRCQSCCRYFILYISHDGDETAAAVTGGGEEQENAGGLDTGVGVAGGVAGDGD